MDEVHGLAVSAKLGEHWCEIDVDVRLGTFGLMGKCSSNASERLSEHDGEVSYL